MIPALKKTVKNVKKRRQQMPMPTDIQDYFFNSDSASAYEKAQEHFPVEQNQSIRHLHGKYERYYLDEERKLIIKDLVSIGSDGNATLSINLVSINDAESFCAQLLAYVGRFSYDDIECLYTICSTIDGHNVPIARLPEWRFCYLPILLDCYREKNKCIIIYIMLNKTITILIYTLNTLYLQPFSTKTRLSFTL